MKSALKTRKSNRPPPPPAKRPPARRTGRYLLRLFVAGATARSLQSVRRIQTLCATELKGGCKLEVIDIYQQPKLARVHQIIATPTLIMEFPKPVRRFVGNLTNITGLSIELDLDIPLRASANTRTKPVGV